MKYDIIKLWHNIAKNWKFGRNIPRTEIKSTATCNSISPLYIFPCKLELISRRANKEEIALSLSPDQIRSSKMAVHFFNHMAGRAYFWNNLLLDPMPGQAIKDGCAFFGSCDRGWKYQTLSMKPFFGPSSGWLINKWLYIFFWIRCNRNLRIPILCLEKVMVNSHPEKVAVIRVEIESK